MINDDDFVGLAEDCINICDVLWAGVERKNIDDLSNSVKEAIVNLGECVHCIRAPLRVG